MGGAAQFIAKNQIQSSGADVAGNRFGGSIYMQGPTLQGFGSATGEYGGFIETKGTIDSADNFNVTGSIKNGRIVHLP